MATSIETLAKRYYDSGLWGKDELKRLVAAGKLSQAAYKRITGETYKA
ncbi:MAG: XkdX family protein [Atopobiaceae bacterium]|nr:XkdX family protein [Atopobiaceae bacterium]